MYTTTYLPWGDFATVLEVDVTGYLPLNLKGFPPSLEFGKRISIVS